MTSTDIVKIIRVRVLRWLLGPSAAPLRLYRLLIVSLAAIGVLAAVRFAGRFRTEEVVSLTAPEARTATAATTPVDRQPASYENAWMHFPARTRTSPARPAMEVKELPKVRLTLCGVAVAGANSVATFEDDRGEQYVRRTGGDVLGYRVEAIGPDRVKLSRVGEEFQLLLPKTDAGSKEVRKSFFTLPAGKDREETAAGAAPALAEMLDSVRLVPVRDREGRVSGLKIAGATALFEKGTGLKDGDVILAVNGNTTRSPEGILRAVQVLRGESSSLDISVLRGAQALAMKRDAGEKGLHLVTK